MKTTGTLMIALATVITVAAAMPVMAANDQAQSSQARPAAIKHSMMMHHAKADLANANASANTPLKEEIDGFPARQDRDDVGQRQ